MFAAGANFALYYRAIFIDSNFLLKDEEFRLIPLFSWDFQAFSPWFCTKIWIFPFSILSVTPYSRLPLS